MLGLADIQIAAALFGCLAITLFGVIYGVVNWNSGGEEKPAKPHRRHSKKRH